jgi:hypothetical protein
VAKLRRVLVAYSWRNPEIGYCQVGAWCSFLFREYEWLKTNLQGMNMLAATLLLACPTEEDAFWILCCIVEVSLGFFFFFFQSAVPLLMLCRGFHSTAYIALGLLFFTVVGLTGRPTCSQAPRLEDPPECLKPFRDDWDRASCGHLWLVLIPVLRRSTDTGWSCFALLTISIGADESLCRSLDTFPGLGHVYGQSNPGRSFKLLFLILFFCTSTDKRNCSPIPDRYRHPPVTPSRNSRPGQRCEFIRMPADAGFSYLPGRQAFQSAC